MSTPTVTPVIGTPTVAIPTPTPVLPTPVVPTPVVPTPTPVVPTVVPVIVTSVLPVVPAATPVNGAGGGGLVGGTVAQTGTQASVPLTFPTAMTMTPTPGATNGSSSSAADSKSGLSGSQVGYIIAGILGGAVLLFVFAGLFVIWRKKKREDAEIIAAQQQYRGVPSTGYASAGPMAVAANRGGSQVGANGKFMGAAAREGSLRGSVRNGGSDTTLADLYGEDGGMPPSPAMARVISVASLLDDSSAVSDSASSVRSKVSNTPKGFGKSSYRPSPRASFSSSRLASSSSLVGMGVAAGSAVSAFGSAPGFAPESMSQLADAWQHVFAQLEDMVRRDATRSSNTPSGSPLAMGLDAAAAVRTSRARQIVARCTQILVHLEMGTPVAPDVSELASAAADVLRRINTAAPTVDLIVPTVGSPVDPETMLVYHALASYPTDGSARPEDFGEPVVDAVVFPGWIDEATGQVVLRAQVVANIW
ncbi:hypothetical protein BC828DRAFT_378620 [Blastocladiella britannica]|nr:hypothetical protein BC828DRAFT_378620 [Blastocladiella britannica]